MRGICSRLFEIFQIGAGALCFLLHAENICNETPPENRAVDGIPAYAQCSTSTGSVYSNNGIDTRAASGGSGWIRTQSGGGYQCTEFAFRYLAFRWNIKSAPNGNAGTWGDNALPAGLVKKEIPVHGDIIVFAPGSCGAGATTGHVAVVDIVADSTITIVEQNGASRRKCKASCARWFIHAEANNGGVAVLSASADAEAPPGISVSSGGSGITIRLSGCFASGASVRVFNLRGRLVADLTKRAAEGRVTFKAGSGPPAPLVVSVRKGGRTVCMKVVTAE